MSLFYWSSLKPTIIKPVKQLSWCAMSNKLVQAIYATSNHKLPNPHLQYKTPRLRLQAGVIHISPNKNLAINPLLLT